MNLPDLARYALLAGVAATAEANRRHYHMRTTWLPHLALNAAALLLPDLLRRALPSASQGRGSLPSALAAAAREIACERPAYAAYAAPLAAGYMLSHPQFNIYKGAWGEMRLAGLGFDALPHAAAGFALSATAMDAASALDRHLAPSAAGAGAAGWAARHRAITALAGLAAVTALWELAEYWTHRYELAQRGDASAINMQWSVEDTVGDVLANLLGWLAAAFWRGRRRDAPQ